MKTKLIIVGGFLGAGKTSLLYATAQKLLQADKKVGLITNDQASQLVDTTFLSQISDVVEEVSGSCFCCNFDGFAQAIRSVETKNNGGLILAEPVGSCTDLSATILQPLKDKLADIAVAPMTVLADPQKLKNTLDGNSGSIHKSAAYIIDRQFDEADIILINKSDTLDEGALTELKKNTIKKWPQATVMTCSAKTGDGIDTWLDEVLARNDSGTHLTSVDYDIYAEGEAVLGWLNTRLQLSGDSVNWSDFASALMDALGDDFDSTHSAVGHVKILLKNETGSMIANLTGTRDTLSLRGTIQPSSSAELTLNARVEMSPELLEQRTMATVQRICGDAITFTIDESTCLMPGRPNPTYHYTTVQ